MVYFIVCCNWFKWSNIESISKKKPILPSLSGSQPGDFPSSDIIFNILLKYSWFTMFLISTIHQSDPAICVCVFFLYYLPSSSNPRDCTQFPVLYCRTPLLICYKCNSWHLSNPKLPLHHLLSPLSPGKHKSAVHVHGLFLFCRWDQLYHILGSTYKWYHIVFVLL